MLSYRNPGYFKGVILFAPALRSFPNQNFLKSIVRTVGNWFPLTKTVNQKTDTANKNKNCS